MQTKEVIVFNNNVKAVICPNFYDLILKSLKYPPLIYNKKLDKVVLNIIKPGVIEINDWNAFVNYWRKYSVFISYAFFNPKENYIFINLQVLGIKASPKDCSLYTIPNTDTYQFLAEIIAHELIHYVFQNYINRIYTYIKPLLLLFYKTFWKNIFDDNVYAYVADTNFMLAIDMNNNIVDEKLAIKTRNNIKRFIQILRQAGANNVKDESTLNEVLEMMERILYGETYSISPRLQTYFQEAYTALYKAFPTGILHGQELIYASEILANATTSIKTYIAENITKRLLSVIE